MSFPTHLDRQALEELGVLGWPFGMADRVRFGELDALNHVNNVAFLQWFENVRVPYMVARGFTNYSHTDADPQLVVRHQHADYLAPLHQDEAYIITARTRLLKPTSFIMEHAVIVEGETRVTGEVVMISLTHNGTARREHKADAVQNIIKLDGAETG